MTPTFRKLALTSHITFSIGWFGAVAAFFALAIGGLLGKDAQLVRASYLSMELIGWFVIVPACLASLLSGVIQSLGTPWGLFQHYWVLIKFLLTVVATIFLLLHMQPVGFIADMVSHTISDSEFSGLRMRLVVDAGAALVVLLSAIILSVYKPWGRTSYGRMRLEGATSVNAIHTTSKGIWERYAWIVVVVIVVLFIIIHLTGGGLGHH
ncbi:MAG: hypothetical protein U0289_03835 [Cyclobacteriaceae bacterium]|nr:hypothetical protein [Cyclobacteriaceae bacterium]